MYHDFIYRVHHVRENPDYSNEIRKCCDYIRLSVERKIRTADLASLAGYTEYYLSEKFKKETGVSLNTYIRNVKTERAKVLLETTDLSIREIAYRLAFNTPNYFIQSFRETVGMTPAQYRRTIHTEK
jgi:AraC-like DNA-binding protein